MESLMGSKDPVKKLADKHQRVLAHIQQLHTNKIDVCEDRFEWIEWAQEYGGTFSDPYKLLVLNCSGKESILGKLLQHAYKLAELNDVAESFDNLKWVMERISPPRKSDKQESKQSKTAYEASQGPHASEGMPASSIPASLESDATAVAEEPDAVLLVCGRELTVFQELVAGTVFLKGKPVLLLAEGATQEICDNARKWSASTWPVFSEQGELLQYLEHDLLRHLRLQKLIHHDIYRRLDPHKSVNLAWYALTRGALALVPFGVHALNTASLFDLCRQCMLDTGMRADKQAQKSMATDAGKAGVMEFACNSASDVYQLMVQGAILTEMVEAGSVAAAMATLDLADAFLLGSVSVVTGAIAAVTAYVSRPQLVDSIADVVVMLQYTYCLNSQLRRNAQCVGDGS